MAFQKALAAAVLLDNRKEIDFEESLNELKELSNTLEIDIVGLVTQKRKAPDPAHYMGKGKINELKELIDAHEAELVIFDHELSARQAGNLEDSLGVKVIDRVQLIMRIFEKRARTKEAKLQIELCNLQYELPRLKGTYEELSRLGGGIGTRGPGETQLEYERRVLRKKIKSLKEELERVKKQRDTQRSKRWKMPLSQISLVGYTNVGKSSLFNFITNSEVYVDDMLFATLDPTVRKISLPGGMDAILVDTVGFIGNLPTQLIAAFRATLEEIKSSDLIVHVIDISHPDMDERIDIVEKTISEITDNSDTEVVRVFNKIDLVEKNYLENMKLIYSNDQFISVKEEVELKEFKEMLTNKISSSFKRVEFVIPYHKGEVVSIIYKWGEGIKEEYKDKGLAISSRLPKFIINKINSILSQ